MSDSLIFDTLERRGAVGFENRLSSEDLVTASGLRNVKELHEQLQRERTRGGRLILSTKCNPGGYYLAGTDAEILAYLKMMRSSGISHFQAAKPARDELKRRGKLPKGL